MKVGDYLYFSPNVKFRDLKWDEKEVLINAFIDRVEGFYLEPAEKLDRNKDGFAKGVLCVTTIDFLARISTGIDQTGERIKKWLKDNIKKLGDPDPNDPGKTLADRFYKEFRNGLIHEGRIKKAGQFSYDFKKELVKIQDGIMVINPGILLEEIKESFRKYINQVKNEEFSFQRFRCALIRDFQEDVELVRRRANVE